MWSALDKGSAPVQITTSRERRARTTTNCSSSSSSNNSSRGGGGETAHNIRRTCCRHIAISLLLILVHTSEITQVSGGNELWPLERPDGMPSITSLEVMCGKDHMDVHLSFSQPFEGIVSSKGQHSDQRCIYVQPSTKKTFYTFRIAYSRCGTKPDLNGQFYENTVVVQYDKDLLEVWDEAKRLRCEWFNDYEKTASKPPMVIADLDVIQLDFRGDNVDCWMEIQHGKGPWAPPVSGIVPLGSTLTLVVAINDFRGEFDMRVKSCMASDGAGHIIKLSDEFGCVLRPKMISRFLKARAPDERATVITYAFFHAFKFPDALSVHIKCKVEICRHGCLDHCQLSGGIHERKDVIEDVADLVTSNEINSFLREPAGVHHSSDNLQDLSEAETNQQPPQQQQQHQQHHHHQHDEEDSEDYYDIIHRSSSQEYQHMSLKGKEPPKTEAKMPAETVTETHKDDFEQMMAAEHKKAASSVGANPLMMDSDAMMDQATMDEKFPHGPRFFENRIGKPAVAGPRALDLDKLAAADDGATTTKRKRRSIKVRNARSADVGVTGIYEVISEADLDFSPDQKQESVTVFQGKITEEVVYGICMPIPGFSILFILVTSAAICSALIAGSLLYRYQLQKESLANRQSTSASSHHHHPHGHHLHNPNSLASWMTLRVFRQRHHPHHNLQDSSPSASSQPPTEIGGQ